MPLRKGERFDLCDLLTGIGSAMGASNERLRVTGAPSLLREFTMAVRFQACVGLAPDRSTVWFRTAASRLPQPPLLSPGALPNVRLTATYIAAPALRPAIEPVKVIDP